MSEKVLAAVDLGSNSFRLEIGKVQAEQIYPFDTLKETVRLASGLTEEKLLDSDSQMRALDALSRFGERVRGFAPETVRAVATNTLRVAKNAATFLPAAEAALGFPIEIIGGREEARLIYLGASHSLPPSDESRLVVDIGGGSTEFVIGERFEPQLLESVFMGCVSYSNRFFPDGRFTRAGMRQAILAAGDALRPIVQAYQQQGWEEAVGSSGTARAIADICEAAGFNPGGVTGITRQGLSRLADRLVSMGEIRPDALPGLRGDRLPVLPGGVAILRAVFDAFNLTHMRYAEGALRLGVLYDLYGRSHHHDKRDATVALFARRYQIDPVQAQRVASLARFILFSLRGESAAETDDAHFLDWAAQLHELGLSIGHAGYHKHTAYVLSFADMPGFSRQDQARLACLALAHRGKLMKIQRLPGTHIDWELIFALRLAVVLCRSRDDFSCPEWQVCRSQNGYDLMLPALWLDANPLTASALANEVEAWKGIGRRLRVRKVPIPVAVG